MRGIVPEHYARPGPKDLWLIGKLVRRGYRFVNASSADERGRRWWSLYLPRVEYVSFDPCDLIVTFSEGDLQMEASFRLAEPDIHVKCYLLLRTRDGLRRLEEFEELYRRIRLCRAHEISGGVVETTSCS
jgi:hypothetical protein